MAPLPLPQPLPSNATCPRKQTALQRPCPVSPPPSSSSTCSLFSCYLLPTHRPAVVDKLCINCWSSPRCCSTSLMYAFAQRNDTQVWCWCRVAEGCCPHQPGPVPVGQGQAAGGSLVREGTRLAHQVPPVASPDQSHSAHPAAPAAAITATAAAGAAGAAADTLMRHTLIFTPRPPWSVYRLLPTRRP